MKVLVATDAWHPQVNGVVRTLGSLARAATKLGATIDFLTPGGFPSYPVPTYPGLRLAWPGRRAIAERIDKARPDAIHLATEGPIGFAVRNDCRRRGRPFTKRATPRGFQNISGRLRRSPQGRADQRRAGRGHPDRRGARAGRRARRAAGRRDGRAGGRPLAGAVDRVRSTGSDFTVALAAKDLGLATGAADLPQLAAARDWLRAAAAEVPPTRTSAT